MLTTRFTKLVGCSVPIQQAGMGTLANKQLAAAVANAGGQGMLSWSGMRADMLAETLDDLRRQTLGVFGRVPVHRFESLPLTMDTIGAIETMPHWAGESVDGVKKLQSAANIIQELAGDAEELLQRWRGVDDTATEVG